MPTLSYLNTCHFDFGVIERLPKELGRLGAKRPLIATDPGIRGAGLLDRVLATLPEGAGLPVYEDTPPNPTEEAVMTAFDLYTAEGCDAVVAVGGGSSMDLGKAVALLAGSGGPLGRFDPREGGQRNVKAVAPLIAVPTTSGTGSEVSLGFVVIMNDGFKATFASPKVIPPVALCDPELTLGLPPHLTAGTGMDAITHCIEAVLSTFANPPADGVGLDGLWRGWRYIRRAVADGSDREARYQMMMASTEGAYAFVKGLGAVHAMSHAAGRLPEPRLHHGTLNAVILPTALRFNAPACDEQYARLRQAMGLGEGADLAAAVEEMNAGLGLPPNLSAMGLTGDMLDGLVENAAKDLAGRTNPRPVTEDDYRALFVEAMG